jgi:hypothetical protein
MVRRSRLTAPRRFPWFRLRVEQMPELARAHSKPITRASPPSQRSTPQSAAISPPGIKGSVSAGARALPGPRSSGAVVYLGSNTSGMFCVCEVRWGPRLALLTA